MRSSEVLILAGAGLLAWLLVSKVMAATPAATATAKPTMDSQTLAWYLNDIYTRLNGPVTY